MRKTPNVVSGIGAFGAAEIARASTRWVSLGFEIVGARSYITHPHASRFGCHHPQDCLLDLPKPPPTVWRDAARQRVPTGRLLPIAGRETLVEVHQLVVLKDDQLGP